MIVFHDDVIYPNPQQPPPPRATAGSLVAYAARALYPNAVMRN